MKRYFLAILFLCAATLAYTQSVDGAFKTLTASGTNTYTITEPTPSTYSNKERFLVRFTNANTGAATLNRSGLGAKDIKKADGSNLTAGDIQAGGTYLLSYNGTYYQVVGDGGSGGGSPVDTTAFIKTQGTSILTDNVDVDLNGRVLSFNGLASSISQTDSVISLNATGSLNGIVDIEAGRRVKVVADTLDFTGTDVVKLSTGNSSSLLLNQNKGNYFTDLQANQDGLKYGALYALDNDSSLVHKKYVDDAMSGTALINGSGTTANGSAVNLGGTITSNTVIDANTKSFGIVTDAGKTEIYIDTATIAFQKVDNIGDRINQSNMTIDGINFTVASFTSVSGIDINKDSVVIGTDGAGSSRIITEAGNIRLGISGDYGTTGKFLGSNGSGGVSWLTPAPTAHTLDSHSNVTITANSVGELLRWDGSVWRNATLDEAGASPQSFSHASDATSHTVTLSQSGGTFKLIEGSNISLSTSVGEVTISSTAGGTGDVVGPASSVNNRVVFFDGTTGKLIKDSGLTLSGTNTGDQTSIVGITGTTSQFNTALTDGEFATLAGSETLTNKTISPASNTIRYPTRTQAGTSYTLQASDENYTIEFSSGSPIAVTLPNGLADNFACNLVNAGGGVITISATGTLQSAATTIETQYTGAYVQHKGSNVWSASGALGPALTLNNITGDVSTSQIENGAVTLAKMADMATGSLIYRKTAGTGAPEVQTLATLKTDLGLTGTNSGDQTITLTGDVTGSGTGSFAATIANDAVTYAKIQNVTDARLIGRSAGSAGDAQEITVGSGLTLSGGSLTRSAITTTKTIVFAVGSSVAVTTGGKTTTRIICPYTGTITGWKMISDQSTTTTLDVWKHTAIPTNSNTITASAKPGLTASEFGASTTLTGWTTSVTEGDILMMEVETNNNAQYISLMLTIQVIL